MAADRAAALLAWATEILVSNRFAVVAFGAVAIVAITATLMIPPSNPPPPDKAAPSVAPAPTPGSPNPAVAPQVDGSSEAPAPAASPPIGEPDPIRDDRDKRSPSMPADR
jgi:hypothetical protein